MLIRDIMVDHPVYVEGDSPLGEVVEVMAERGIGFMVVAEQGRALGVLTEGDLVRLAASGVDMKAERVRDHMHAPVFSVKENANVFHAYDELVLRNMRHLVVENDTGELVGVVTMSSFIANLGVEHFSELQTIADIMHPVDDTVSKTMPVMDAIQLMNACKHAIIVLDDGKPVGILTSRGIARLCRQPVAEWEKLTMKDVMRPPVCIHRKSFVPEASILMKHNQTRHLIVTGDHDEFMGLVTISDVAHSMEGRYVEFMRSVMRDMEHDLLTADSQNRALFERNPNAVFSLDMEGMITHVNPAAILVTGHGNDYLVGRYLTELYDESCKFDGNEAFSCARKGEAQSVHLRMHGSNDEIIHVFMSFVPIMVSSDISGVYAVAFDITERVLAERRLHKLSQALQQAGEPIAIADAYGVIEFANLRMHQLFGYQDGEMTGRKLAELELEDGEESEYETVVWPSVAEGVPYKGEFLHRAKSGATLDLRLSSAPVHVPGAERVDYFVNIYEDMTHRREMEQHALQAQKMETIGTLAGGIAHDFNNYLGMVTGSLYMLKRECAHMPETVARLGKLEKITDNAASLIAQLMTFSRKEKLMKQTISCSSLVEESRDLSRLLIPKKVALHWQVAKHVYVDGNAGQLQQVLLNLLRNASDAVKDVDNPQISVKLSTVEIADEQADRSGLKAGEDYALIAVSDNGCGIPEKDKDSIFDPFFTTKGVGEGTGMGLAMVYGAIQGHHGWIECLSEEEKGSEFRIYLPLASGTESAVSEKKEGDRWMLIADDEPIMLTVGGEILGTLGYQVDACDNGEDALNLFREHPGRYAAVMLDVMMPRQNGTETAIGIRKIQPDMPILFATGFDKDAIPESLLAQSGVALIHKPWSVETLKAALKEIMEGDESQ